MKKLITQNILDDRAVPGGRCLSLTLRADDGDAIPGVLRLPAHTERAPAALLLHGYSSRKEHMADTAGVALLEHGVASLAIDLPMHGERLEVAPGRPAVDPLGVMRSWQTAQDESTLALRYLAARNDIDRTRLALVGYSLGAYLGLGVAARDPAVRAVVVAAGGDLPANTPFAPVIRAFADPVRSVRKITGRPLLIVHGRADRTIRPDQAQRLFETAGEPKEIRWWDAGHYLPPQAIRDAAAWLAERMAALGKERATVGADR